MRRVLLALAAALAAGGCVTQTPAVRALRGQTPALPSYAQATAIQMQLRELPPPERPVAVAVYAFTDQTGQFQRAETGQTLSRAVSQGGGSMLMRALQDAGRRQWFTVIEREQVQHLLQERQIIREMRERYLGEREVNPQALPALLFAGVLLEGGVVGYDSNTFTGGAGAAFLGVGGRTEYRQDTVTVYLRAVSTRTGEVLTTVTATKTIASVALGGSAFRYVGFRELLEAEAGITRNEPDQLALQQAIEKAVFALVLEGAEQNLWQFRDTQAAWPTVWRYRQERDGELSPEQVERASRRLREEAARSPARPVVAAGPARASSAGNRPVTGQRNLTPTRSSAVTPNVPMSFGSYGAVTAPGASGGTRQ